MSRSVSIQISFFEKKGKEKKRGRSVTNEMKESKNLGSQRTLNNLIGQFKLHRLHQIANALMVSDVLSHLT